MVGDLMLRIQRIPDFTPKLLLVRKRLLGLEPEGIKYVVTHGFVRDDQNIIMTVCLVHVCSIPFVF